MPITKQSFPNFYMGHAAESMFAGELYLMGYEATKAMPDFGIDYFLGNAARQKFYGEPARTAEVQVKSTLGYDGKATFVLSEDELDYLKLSSNRFLVCYIFQDFHKPIDLDSANLRQDLAEMACARDISRYEERQMEEHGSSIKYNNPEVIFEFRYKMRTIFWLNGEQLKNGISNQHWRPNKEGKLTLAVDTKETTVWIDGSPIFEEMHDLAYLMKPPLSFRAFEKGKYLDRQL